MFKPCLPISPHRRLVDVETTGMMPTVDYLGDVKMFNRLFVLAFVSAVIATPFLVLATVQQDKIFNEATSLKTYDRCSTLSVTCGTERLYSKAGKVI